MATICSLTQVKQNSHIEHATPLTTPPCFSKIPNHYFNLKNFKLYTHKCMYIKAQHNFASYIMENKPFDLRVHINGKHTFFLHKSILCKFSGTLRKMSRRSSYLAIQDFPGGHDGFELVSRFCYSDGTSTATTPANVSVLHCSAFLLEMTSLSKQADAFLGGLPCWPWTDVAVALRGCDRFFSVADSSGLLEKLVSAAVERIKVGFDFAGFSTSSPSSFSPSSSSSANEADWWFGDLTVLSPYVIEKIVSTLAVCTNKDDQRLIHIRFLLHYMEKKKDCGHSSREQLKYCRLADAVVDGVALVAATFRRLLWALSVVGGLGMSEERRKEMERMIGERLDGATVDDLLVAGGRGSGGGAYAVGLVTRLARAFAECGGVREERMRRVGVVMDKYLLEIAPDQGLKAGGFLGVAMALPDSARECFDGVYRALDIYLESHPTLSFEERTNLCQCLNYEKLTLEACRDLAMNPKIPPAVSFRALVAKYSELKIRTDGKGNQSSVGVSKSRVLACATNTKAFVKSSPQEATGTKGQRRVQIEKEKWELMDSRMVKTNKSVDQICRGFAMLC